MYVILQGIKLIQLNVYIYNSSLKEVWVININCNDPFIIMFHLTNNRKISCFILIHF